MSVKLPSYEDIVQASRVLDGVARRTPVLTSRMADEKTNAQVFFKCENFQRVGAFKFRGGYNAVANLSDQQRKAGVVTFSSGNHAQAIALAAKLQNVGATIVMPHDAPAAKKAATLGYGARIVEYDRYTEDRAEIGHQLSVQHGYSMIPPFDHPDVIAGQGTAVKELIEQVGELDQLFVPLGGGGLLSGSLLAAQALSPRCAVYGVEPEAGNDAQQSLRQGRIVRIKLAESIADGALTAALGLLTFPLIQRYVRDIFTVTDDQLVEAMRFFAERMKIVVEPTGCLGAAALFGQSDRLDGQRIGVVISGGNVDMAAYSRLLSPRQ